MTTQKERVYCWLKEYGSITSWQAIEQFGVTRLSAVILQLRKDGFEIKSEWKSAKNRYGDIVSFVEYKLVQDEF